MEHEGAALRRDMAMTDAAGGATQAAQARQQALLRHLLGMPPVAALQLQLVSADDARLVLSAPLAANVNDKGCAFGGSLVSLMTLAGWALVTLRLMRAGVDAEVFVAESQVQYLKPLYQDLQAVASAGPDADWETFIATVRERGRARIEILAEVPMADGGIATRSLSRYAAIIKR